MTKFSMIIPTMWVIESFNQTIKEYLKSNLIDEIIIIDNKPNSRPKLPIDDRIKILSKGHNIFVNPAWNWGVKEAKNDNLIFANDDVILIDIDKLLYEIVINKFPIIGVSIDDVNDTEGIHIEQVYDPMKRGFGCFFYINKSNYIFIPDDLKIFYGDTILYNSSIERYIFKTKNFKFQLSKTIKSDSKLISLIENYDKPIFNEKYKKLYQFNK